MSSLGIRGDSSQSVKVEQDSDTESLIRIRESLVTPTPPLDDCSPTYILGVTSPMSPEYNVSESLIALKAKDHLENEKSAQVDSLVAHDSLQEQPIGTVKQIAHTNMNEIKFVEGNPVDSTFHGINVGNENCG